jgi:integrase
MGTRASKAAKAAPAEVSERPESAPAKSNRTELTRAKLDALRKVRPHKPSVIWDTKVTGLAVLINRGRRDARSATLAFRTVFYLRTAPGKPVYMSIGRYPDGTYSYVDNGKKHTISCGDLVAVRRVAGIIRARAEQGDDPRRPKPTGSFANWWNGVPDDDKQPGFLKGYADTKRAASETRRIFATYIVPELGDRDIKEITRSDVSALLAKIRGGKIAITLKNGKTRKVGTRSMAWAVRTRLVTFFNWYETNHDADFRSPVPKLMKNDPLKPAEGEGGERERALVRPMPNGDWDDSELRALWIACDEMGKGDPYAILIKTALLTMQRFHKVSAMRRSDIKDGVWDASRPNDPTNKKVSPVPLPKLAQDLINSVPVIDADMGTDHVFSCNGRSVMRGWSWWKVKLDRKVLEVMRRENPGAILESWQTRDLRRTARTLMSRIKINPEVAEHAMGHRKPKIERTYNKNKFLSEKRVAFQQLSDEIQRVVGPPDNNVLPFERRAG